MALLAVLFYACSSPTDTTADRHDQVVMDWSEKFASAVEIYPKEEGRLMERVARCWLEELDNPVQALRVAREIPNWRQAVMLADIARVLAGDPERQQEALAINEEALTYANTSTESWQRGRAKAHIGMAYTQLGMASKAAEIYSNLQDVDEKQKVEMSAIVTMAKEGKYEEALEILHSLKDIKDFYGAISRTENWLRISRLDEVQADDERLEETLDGAYASARGIPVWGERVRYLIEVAERMIQAGRLESAKVACREALEGVESALDAPKVYVQMRSRIHRLQVACGDREDAIHGIDEMTDYIENSELVHYVDHPLIYADIAAVALSAGESEKGWELIDKALQSCASQPNSRIRCIGAVHILNLIAAGGWDMAPERLQRVEELYASLGHPW
jgi:tetratricopeptide (TPR) repeat protein